MHVIAKMECKSVEDYGFSRKFKFSCVHDSGINIGDTPENISFTKATPSGEAWMTVDNQYVWPEFHPPVANETLKGQYPTYKPSTQHYVVFINAKEFTLDDVHRALAGLQHEEAPAT
jgi:hypothetical protein